MSEKTPWINILELLREMNIKNHDNIVWWAFNFTAKNPLSSPLIDKLAKNLAKEKKNDSVSWYLIFLAKFFALLKLFFLFFEKEIYFRKKKVFFPKIAILSFLDGQKQLIQDTYFGYLRTKVSEEYPSQNIGFIYLCYRPYSKFIVKLNNKDIHLLSLLTLKDFIWIGWKVLKININKFDIPKHILVTVSEQMLEEIQTTFIYNLSVYRAFLNTRSTDISSIIYPFENKSIEKMLLIGIDKNVKSIGYQHSSVSFRHFNFVLSRDELRTTPLPKKIITCGSVTKKFLIFKGNFDSSRIKKGCELRNTFSLKKRNQIKKNVPFKLLICFSSSHEEIFNAVKILKSKFKKNGQLNITFRFHGNFPFDGLPEKEKEWIRNNITVSYNKSLQRDLDCNDILGYVTSSVSIIALKHGIPVIQLYPVSPLGDPLFEEKIPNRFFLKENNIIKTIEKISTTKASEIEDGVKYALKYFAKPTRNLIKEFLSAY